MKKLMLGFGLSIMFAAVSYGQGTWHGWAPNCGGSRLLRATA
jgi:hypothetical protein